MAAERIEIGSPWFEDLRPGQVFDEAPAVTLTSGHAAFHEAAYGDRLRLPLDAELCRAVTSSDRPLANPNMVGNVAIGQTTFPSGRVIGNLFYRGLVLQRPVYLGDTLRTRATIAAPRQNRPKPGRPATGMAVFEMHVENQRGETVLHFWRYFDDVPDGATFVIGSRATVTCAPEITRLTLNVASAHIDGGASAHGRRLVYGGQTISAAAAQIVRALPNLVTFIAWRSCDHTAPVFEGDVLRTEFEVEAKHPLPGGGGLLDLRARVHAERGPGDPAAGQEVVVLDWRSIAWLA